uniref:Uncharacterized protein n=1 Tax=Lactuca sativa TaxID=4236 RepID=A0A9R1WYF0_LACSA|nr:hypothetical protein LSAT_V11C800422180 [Lactuca sativa]
MVMLFDLRSIWTMISPTTTTTSARHPPSGRIHYLSLTLRFCSNAIPSLSSTFVPVCIGWTGWSRPQLLHKPIDAGDTDSADLSPSSSKPRIHRLYLQF